MSAPASKVSGYMPQLDGLRAIAVLMVFVTHWLPGFQGSVPWGSIGVDGFFVLSGFLITGILLGMREESGAPKRSLWDSLKIFMVRRSLRIFPLYFALLAALWLMGEKNVREYAPWCFSYTVNLLICQQDGWVGTVTHLWSLALEEQFYLVWPLLMLVAPWRRIPLILLLAVAAGVVARAVLEARGHGHVFIYVFPASSLDFFAIGGILAWMRRNQVHRWRAWVRHGGWVAAPITLFLVAGWHWGWYGWSGWQVAQVTLVAVAWAFVIARAAEGMGGPAGKLISWRPVMWLGQISYGLYLFHNFIPNGIGKVCRILHVDSWYGLHPGWKSLVYLVATILLAAMSYYLFEKPFLRLKKRWE